MVPGPSFLQITKELANSDLRLHEVTDRIGEELTKARNRGAELDADRLQELLDFLRTEQFPTWTRRGIPGRWRPWEPLVRRLVEKGDLPESFLVALKLEMGED
jgi:hypothetical protein